MKIPALLPGDVLLFARTGFYNRLIMLKTWSAVSHVEVVVSGHKPPTTVASRNGKGVGHYQMDADGLYAVLRPRAEFDDAKAWAWFRSVVGQGYDWLGLVAFLSAKYQGRDNGKQFCSEFATRYLRAGGIDPFAGYDADGIAPSEFLKSPSFERIA